MTGVGRREPEMKAGPGRLLGGRGGEATLMWSWGPRWVCRDPTEGTLRGRGGEPGSWPSCPSDKDTPASGGADRRWNDRRGCRDEAQVCARQGVGEHGLTFWRDPIFVRASGQTAVMRIKPSYVARSITPGGGALALFLFCSRGI